MESSVANFTILPTQNPKRDESMQQEARSDETAISSDNPMIELPHTVPASSSAKELAPARQDDENGAIARRSSELAAIGDTAREFLKEKREKYDELSMLRRHRIREMLVFSVFLVLVSVVAVLARSTLSSSMQTSSLHNYLAEEGHSSSNKSNLKLNMANHGAFDDVREWLQSVFYRRLYSGNSGSLYYSDGSARILPILGNNMIIGSVQVRQLRLKALAVGSTNECKVPSMIARLNPSCYPHFSTDNEETGVLSDYIAFWEAQNNRSASRAELPWAWWTPHSSSFSSSYVYSHFGVDYPNGGYILKMPKDPEAARLALANLYPDQAPNGWLKSNSSAAVFTEWVLYNPNLNVFYLYTTLFENRHAGGISSETFRALNLERFSASDAWSIAIVSGVEVFLFAFVLFYIVIEARNIRRLGLKTWLTDGYSLLMASVICLFIVIIIIEIVLFVSASEFMLRTNLQNIEIRDLSYMVYYTQVVLDMYSVIVLLSWFRLSKYLDIISSKTRMLSETVVRSAPDIAYFLILFFCVFMGFVTAFQVGFGDRIFEFRNFRQSCVGTFRAVLEDFDYDAFKSANSILGPLIIVFFIFTMLFLLVEMFLGIVMANYEEVLDVLGEEEEALPGHLRSVFKKRLQVLSVKLSSCIKKNKIAPEPVAVKLGLREMLMFYEDNREIFDSAGFKSAAELQEVLDNSDGDITIEEIHSFAKMHEKDRNEEKHMASMIANLKHILAVADKVDEELKQMKSLIVS